MERVLVTGAANIGKAGVATIVYKWGQQFDSDKVVYDYLMQSGLPEEKYQDAIREKGGIIYTLEEEKRSMLRIIKWVKEIIETHKYKILHINSDSAYIAAAYIFAAKRAGIEHIYVHSHCTQIDDNNKIKRFVKTTIHKICKPYVIKNTDMFLACSKLAGEWMFGKKNINSLKYKTIFNGVEVEQYLFDQNVREKYRNEFGFDYNYVIGNIGRLSFQKNQSYLIDIFSRYHKHNQNSLLVIVGDGELKEALKEKVKQLKLEHSVVFMGLRNDVPKLLSALDIMVMPSRFEGLPVTMVEAQMSDLPCVVASTITEEADFSNIVKYVEMNDMKCWEEKIDSFITYERTGHKDLRINSSFNIVYAAKELADILCSG